MKTNNSHQLPSKQVKDLKVIVAFVSLYCRKKHHDREKVVVALPSEVGPKVSGGVNLCAVCAELVAYGIQKRKKCPLDPKPSCKNCRIHCYSGEYRARMKEIMAYSGRQMVMRGRLDYLWHYFF
ncbi:nitrous oxide-stimulated promoter family protein [Geobacter pelophilus]|uniref:Nitrous oxide-stimulated promoter family protein n=1 Tax=Geoanaerobacter pelophilus TaxID=60036 RepID=A0AAW4L7L0_9BACT|nr:nitrous oxide-stimulated promoter family protein [Geoanaerobacter pelophilus]MBT0663787.1 nitrous oxide-stimulated promoter family protein [Geoanaerobacter pelophilus]